MNSLQSILSEAHEAIRNIYGSRLSKVLLYGSYARGEQTKESDIDLLVVLKGAEFSAGKEIRLINNSLFPLGFKNNLSISAHPVSENKFNTIKSFFLNRVRAEGKEL